MTRYPLAGLDVARVDRREYRLNSIKIPDPKANSMLSSHSDGARSLPSAGNYVAKLNIFNALFFSLGALINSFSYLSFAPVIVGAIFYAVTCVFLVLTPLGGAAEQRIFSRVFSVGFLMAGIAAVYANQFQDAEQLFGDPAGFFDMATGKSAGMSLIEIQIIHEGALGIVLWRALYDFFASMGFEKARYIGITVNVTMVALAGVIGIKFVRQIFGNDDYRFERLTLLVAACGLFWLFSGIHVRDSAVLLAVTALAYAWVYFLAKPDLSVRLITIIFWSLLAAALFGFLRGDFIFVPFAMAVAAIVALLLGYVERSRRWVVFGLMVVGCVIVALLAKTFSNDIALIMDSGQTVYSEIGAEQHAADSLGIALIVNQPTPIRLVLGSIYLLVLPIPFWSGFQLESAYNLFKTANALYFYFVIPLLFIALNQILFNKKMRTPVLLFLVFLFLGFTLAIAYTSLETRHFGAFLLPILLLATLPDLRVPIIWRNYKIFSYIMLASVLLVHLAWIVLKL